MPGGRLPGILIVALAATAAPLSLHGAESEPIRCRQNEFFIPFRIHRQTSEPDAPAEVQLYCATPDGQPWQLAQRVKPDAGGFKFKAPADGEYLFCLRIQDRQGRIVPAEPYRVELRVAVDTLAPRLELKAQRGPAGELKVQWQGSDKSLRAESLRIEYQTVVEGAAQEGPWRMLAITPERGGVARDSITGEAIWWPEDRSAAIALRAEIVDLAGNRTVTQARVDRAPAAKSDAVAAAGPQPKPATKPDAGTGISAQPVSQKRGASGSFADGTNDDSFDGGDWNGPPAMGRPTAGDATTNAPAAPPAPPTDSSTWQAAPPVEPQAWPADQTSASTLWREAAGGVTSAGHMSPTAPRTNIGGATPQPPSSTPTVGAQPLAPAGSKHVVTSKKFALAYPSQGRPGAELWGTVDGGRTWGLVAVDRDAVSPLDAQVSRAGTYGFRIVVPAANGLSAPAPRSGQPPEFWVEVRE